MDFRTFVNLLDSENEVLWVKSEVDPTYELGALLRQAENRRKAIWFEKVKGSRFPAVGGVMSSPERHAMSLGMSPRQLKGKDGWASLIASARANPLPSREVVSGPAADWVIDERQVNLAQLPIPRFFADDSHNFITAGLGIVSDPETGNPNVGFYRAPVIDGQHLSISAGQSSRLHQIYGEAEQAGESLKIAYVIGAPPALLITAGCRINRDESDFDIAGALQGKPLELMRCRTSDLLVPASAEFVIEAEVDFSRKIDHMMGEFPDNYGITRSPLARITTITHRKNAVFHTILGGMNREHNALGIYIFCGLREQLLNNLQSRFPGLRDIHVDLTPRRMGARCQINVALEKSSANEPHELIEAIYADHYDTFPLAFVVQRVVVVDEDVNLQNPSDVEWAIAMRMNAASKLKVIEVPAKGGGTTARLAIDATLDADKREAGKRPVIPGADEFPLDRYL